MDARGLGAYENRELSAITEVSTVVTQSPYSGSKRTFCMFVSMLFTPINYRSLALNNWDLSTCHNFSFYYSKVTLLVFSGLECHHVFVKMDISYKGIGKIGILVILIFFSAMVINVSFV